MILLCTVVCCFVVGQAAPGANINVQVIQHIEHAEGEVSAALTIFPILFIRWFCFYMYVFLRAIRAFKVFSV